MTEEEFEARRAELREWLEEQRAKATPLDREGRAEVSRLLRHMRTAGRATDAA